MKRKTLQKLHIAAAVIIVIVTILGLIAPYASSNI